MVEMSAMGFSLAVARESVWDVSLPRLKLLVPNMIDRGRGHSHYPTRKKQTWQIG